MVLLYGQRVLARLGPRIINRNDALAKLARFRAARNDDDVIDPASGLMAADLEVIFTMTSVLPSDFEAYRIAAQMPWALPHPVVAEETYPNFLSGGYDTAVLQLSKPLELRLQKRAAFLSRKGIASRDDDVPAPHLV